jgi:hypothetical protein
MSPHRTRGGALGGGPKKKGGEAERDEWDDGPRHARRAYVGIIAARHDE